MRPDQFARLKEILYTLPTLPRERRRAYVESQCRDDEELLAEALSFAELDADAPEILRTGALTSVARGLVEEGAWTPERPLPDRVGPYEISGVLGRGGMGMVYSAMQVEPLRREVAIKVLWSRIASEQIFARFEAERQTLAVLEHGNIARILDAGSTDEGVPYFVMELVRGISINEYCRREEPTVSDRIRLFRQVCSGVLHAHQKGIIHRDLKPSNLLVTEHEGVPTVKIIDFGIARALEAAGPAVPLLTQEGQVLGTPEYMSPEQASGETQLVDLRSDVYSLGIVLYELLTQRLPYELAGLTLLERTRVIREAQPPSLRDLPATRNLDPDLDTIVQKALHKDPEDRYASVAALDDDLARFQEGQPILAHPPSTIYQLRKLVRRHKIGFAFAATVAVLLVVFGVTMAVMFEAQRRQHERAEVEARRAQRVGSFLQDMLASADPFDDGMKVTVREVLEQADRNLDLGLSREPLIRMEMRRTLADTYRSLSDREAAVAQMEEAERILGELDEVDDATRARVLLSRAQLLGVEDPESSVELTLDAMRLNRQPEFQRAAVSHLGEVAVMEGQFARAESLARHVVVLTREIYGEDALETVLAEDEVGEVLWQQGKYVRSAEILRRTSDRLREELGETHPRYLTSLNRLAASLFGDDPEVLEEAERLRRQVLAGYTEALGPDHTEVGVAHNNLAFFLMENSIHLDEAEEHMAETVRIWTQSLEAGHPYLPTAYNNLGFLRHIQLDAVGAEAAFREGLALRSVTDSDHPTFAVLLDNLAWVLLVQGRAEEAETSCREALGIRAQCFGEKGSWHAKNLSTIVLSVVLAELERPAEVDSLAGPCLAGFPKFPMGFFKAMLLLAVARGQAMQGNWAAADSLLGPSVDWMLRDDRKGICRVPEEIYALRRSADLVESWGRPEEAGRWRDRAEELRVATLASRAEGSKR